jgi:nitrite reductase/ring-hydroxylating ferredoxin subunit
VAGTSIGKASDFTPGSIKEVQVQGKAYLVANIGGFLYAVDGLCGHAGGKLIEGRLEGSTLRCPRHGAEYDLTTGKNLKKPRIPFAKAADLKSYRVSVKDEDVIIEV